MLSGEKIKLRKLVASDAPTIAGYWDNYELRQYLASPLPTSLEDIEKMIAAKQASFQARNEFFFGIERLDTGELVGLINLESVSWVSRHGFIGLFCIFGKQDRGQGFGREAMIRLLDYAFNMIDLHVVVLWVEAFNASAIGFYQRVGFSNRGTMRELAFRNGKRADVVTMDLLKSEFLAEHGIQPKGDVF